MTRSQRLALVLPIAGLVLRLASAGNLDPSAPPGPTMKTLVEVEPRIAIPGGTGAIAITGPGSYYLAGDRTGVAGQNGITIDTGGLACTLDLNGFSVSGVAGSLDGIAVNSPYATVKNGWVRNFGGDGIVLFQGNVVNVTSGFNGGVGFQLTDVRVADCHAIGNQSGGFTGVATVRNCTATSNGADGFVLYNGSARDCSAVGNQGDGFEALQSAVVGCTSSNNTAAGINAWTNSMAVDNLCFGNATGILASGAAVIKGNHVMSNSTGIASAVAALVVGNTARYNTTDYSLSGTTRSGAIDVLTTQGEVQTNVLANFTY